MKNNARLLPESLVEFLKFFLEEIGVQEQELQRQEEELRGAPPPEELKLPAALGSLPEDMQHRLRELIGRSLAGQILWALKQVIDGGLSMGQAPIQAPGKPPVKGSA